MAGIFVGNRAVANTFSVQAQDDPDEAPAQVIPGTVVVGESTCEAGVPALGTVQVVDDRADILVTYEIERPDASGAYSVTARLVDPATTAWGDLAATGWAPGGSGEAVYAGVATPPACETPVEDTSTEPPVEEPALTTPELEGTTDETLIEEPAAPESDDTGESANRSSDMVVFAATCPAAATGSNVTTSTRINTEKISFENGRESTGGDTPMESQWELISANYSYSATDLQPGDFFTVPLPEGLRSSGTVSRTMTNEDGTPVACLTVSNGIATVVFLDYVADQSRVSGTCFVNYYIHMANRYEDQTVEVTFPGGTVYRFVVPGGRGPWHSERVGKVRMVE